MKNLKQLERLRKIHRMIKLENTGTPSELAEKLHISTRLTYLLLEQLREFDAPLCFNRRTRTYYYKNDFELIKWNLFIADKIMIMANYLLDSALDNIIFQFR